MTTKISKYFAVIALVVGFATTTAAETVGDSTVITPATRMFMLQAGYVSLLDTYLSPLTYTGTSARLGFERLQANPSGRWVQELDLNAELDMTENPAGNHTAQNMNFGVMWSIMHKWQPASLPRWRFMAGPAVMTNAGTLYNSYNSNNVVSARAETNVGINAIVAYNTHLGNRPLTLSYHATLPVAGVFFSPQYDEAYYEIYVGHHSRLTHFGWWGNRFNLIHSLNADLRLPSGLTLRVGYGGNIATSWWGNISTRNFTHNIVLGIGGEWITLSPGKKNINSKIVSPLYEY
ncbi:MAG: DUF3316 domain-containing protein [Muribaculaceae bacterium]|nr:DUF3316 domain-containing protein [Muribaculaceae bacterium]